MGLDNKTDWLTRQSQCNFAFHFSLLFSVCVWLYKDRLCWLVVRVPGYRSRGPGFHFRRYQIFWEVMGLERCPLSHVRIIDELFQALRSRKPRLTAVGIRCADHATLYPLKMALTSSTNGGRSVGIVRLRNTGHGVCFLFVCRII
jgi:hypothetical protein